MTWIPLVATCGFCAFIELAQHRTVRGLCELDDVIANAAGALVGMEVYVHARNVARS